MRLSYKSVLDRHVKGETNKSIAESLLTTKKTVRRIIGKAEELRLLPDAYLTFDEDGLRAKMNPRNKSRRDFYPVDWARIHEELTKRGSKCSDSNHTTMTLLYTEYTSEAEGAGKEAMSKTVFYDTYNMWVKGNQLVSHIKRQPGRRMELDFAGDTVFYINPETDEKVQCVVFVATLTYSNATFVKVLRNQGMELFLQSVIDACEYFGAVAPVWVPDCTKSGVIKGSRTDWAILNSSMEELARAYGAEVSACSPYSPKEKPRIEGNGNATYTKIYAPLRNCTFYSIDDMNTAFRDACDRFNGEPMKERGNASRLFLLENIEKEKMLPLPSTRFEVRRTATANVGKDGFVRSSIDHYYYSVPHEYIGNKVILKSGTDDIIITTIDGRMIAKHPLGTSPYDRHILDPKHLQSYLRQYTEESPQYFIDEAERSGEGTRKVIELILEGTKYPETVYKMCRSVVFGLGRHYGRANLEKACNAALSIYGSTPEARIGYAKLKPLLEEMRKKDGEERRATGFTADGVDSKRNGRPDSKWDL